MGRTRNRGLSCVCPCAGRTAGVKIGWLLADVGPVWCRKPVIKSDAGSLLRVLHCCRAHAIPALALPSGSCGQPPESVVLMRGGIGGGDHRGGSAVRLRKTPSTPPAPSTSRASAGDRRGSHRRPADQPPTNFQRQPLRSSPRAALAGADGTTHRRSCSNPARRPFSLKNLPWLQPRSLPRSPALRAGTGLGHEPDRHIATAEPDGRGTGLSPLEGDGVGASGGRYAGIGPGEGQRGPA